MAGLTGLYLFLRRTAKQKSVDKHPCLCRDSNLRIHFSRGHELILRLCRWPCNYFLTPALIKVGMNAVRLEVTCFHTKTPVIENTSSTCNATVSSFGTGFCNSVRRWPSKNFEQFLSLLMRKSFRMPAVLLRVNSTDARISYESFLSENLP